MILGKESNFLSVVAFHFFFSFFDNLKIRPLFEKAESKNRLLRSVAGEGIEQIGQLQARWDKFEIMMESHELMVKEQVWVIK